ncbi:MAG: hypothetical protein NC131_22145 [Roseburia sp.]|nr:hypothetical protein [Roseburia sp.]
MMTKLTLKDINNYIRKIRLNFENAYSLEQGDSIFLTANWFEILNKYPKEICDQAVNNALAKAQYAPRIGDIVREIEILLNNNHKTDEELWAELMEIKFEVYDLSRDLRYPQHYENVHNKIKTIYDNLSEELKLFLVSTSELVRFSEIPDEEIHYERSLFFKRMPILRQHTENKKKAEEFLLSIENHKKIGDGKKN